MEDCFPLRTGGFSLHFHADVFVAVYHENSIRHFTELVGAQRPGLRCPALPLPARLLGAFDSSKAPKWGAWRTKVPKVYRLESQYMTRLE